MLDHDQDHGWVLASLMGVIPRPVGAFPGRQLRWLGMKKTKLVEH